MTFGASWSPAAGHCVKNRNAILFSKEFPQAVNVTCKNRYFDEWLESFNSEKDAIIQLNYCIEET